MQLRLVASRVIRCLPRNVTVIKPQQNFERYICTVQRNLKPTTSNIFPLYHQQYRLKRRGVKNPKQVQEESDSDSDFEDDNDITGRQENGKNYDVDPGSKVVNYKLDSPRIDRLLRKALNISGKALEDLFYAKKIQVNSEVLIKKGQQVDVGDIITVPLATAQESSGSTARGAIIEVLEIAEDKGSYSIKVSRNKNTLVKV